jgi:hypothetical protein
MKAPSEHMGTVEGRKSDRYRLNAPVFLFWTPQNSPPQSSEGITHDVSLSGVYIYADETPPVEEIVQMDILLPNPVPGCSEIHLTAEGVVLRSELSYDEIASRSRHGFAASVHFYPELSEWVQSHLKGVLPVV